MSGAPTAYLCSECGACWTGEPTCSNYNPDASAVVPCLDLSPPDVVDGVPVRLDALPWGMAVIGRWYNCRFDDIDRLRAMDWGGATTWELVGRGGYLAMLVPEDDGHEEYDHADPNQPRRIVAAILRKGRPGVVS